MHMGWAVVWMGAALVLGGCQAAVSPAPAPAAVSPAPAVSIDAGSMAAWQQGVRAMQAGQSAAAMAAYDRALAADGGNFHALADKGLLLSMAGRYAEGEVCLAEAVRLAPDDLAVHYNRAMHYKLQGRREEAAAEFAAVVRGEPQHAWSLYGLATIAADEGREEQALAYLRRAVAADPATAEAARTQDHFAALRGEAHFREIVGES